MDNTVVIPKRVALDKYLASNDNPLVNTALRYNGFWNDVGEACKSFLPRPLYMASYVATAAYATSCVYYTARRESNNPKQVDKVKDAILWHSLATVSVTPTLIASLKFILKRAGVSKVRCAVIGVASIPLIVPPVDNLVTHVMNRYRDQPEPLHWSGLYSLWSKK